MVVPARLLIADSNEDQSNKSILQHLYFIIAVAVALLLVSIRLYLLRRKNRPVTDFFSIVSSSNSQAPADHAFGSSYQHSHLTPLAPLPSAYRPDRRVNAADTDAAGRRFGGPDDPDWDGKDILPAYNNIDRPPKYDFGYVHPQGHILPPGTNPRDTPIAEDAEAFPVAEQPWAGITGSSQSDRVEPPSAPHHGFQEATT